MKCVRCGSVLRAGQARCSCDQYVDPPASEFYARLESRVEKSSRDNFRQGLLIGLGFLAIFLLLETVMDTVFIAREFSIGTVLLIAAVAIAFNIRQVGRKVSVVNRRLMP